MKILVVMGSPRKGNTYHAVERIEELMRKRLPPDEELTFTYLMLRDAGLAECRGCFNCFTWGEERCPIHDEAAAIEAQMHDADGVIFASPVYGMNVTGLFKTFVDRFAYIFHRPRFFGKTALLVTTTGILGAKEVLEYMDLVASVWGFEVAHRVGLATLAEPLPASQAEENERKLEEAADAFFEALRRPERRSPSFNDIMLFHGQRGTFAEMGKTFPADYQYWKERGWLEKGAKYFVDDVRVNPIYHLAGTVMEWSIRRNARKVAEEMGG